MALTQKQIFISSQLFMAAGKAGLRFDLSQFINNSNYANETLASLAGSAADPALQTLVAQTIMELVPQQDAAAAATPALPAAPLINKPATPHKDESRYVGRLR
jgi:hypothetical protein